MPDEVVPALEWMVPQLLKDLGQAKMWPVKLAHLKHQDKLRACILPAPFQTSFARVWFLSRPLR